MWSTGQGSEAPRGSPVTTWVGVREGPQINPTHPISFPPLPFLVLKSSLPLYLVPGPSTAKGGVGGRAGGGWREVGGRSLRCSSGSGQGVCVCVGGGTVRSSFPRRSPLRAQKGRMTLPLNQLPRTSSRDSRTAQTGLRPRLPPGRGRGPSLPHLTFLVLGVRGPPSAGAVAPRFPKARARGAGPRPRSAAGVRPASDSGGIVPKLFVHRHDGPRPCVCPGGVPGPSPYPGPRPSARPRFSPCAGPRLCPAVSRGGVLGPGGGAGLGPALSAGPGTRDSPTYVVPCLCSASRP